MKRTKKKPKKRKKIEETKPIKESEKEKKQQKTVQKKTNGLASLVKLNDNSSSEISLKEYQSLFNKNTKEMKKNLKEMKSCYVKLPPDTK